MPPASGPSRSWASMVTCCAASRDGADDEILQRLWILRINHLGIDRHGQHLAAPPHRHLHQSATCLPVYLGGGERCLGLHQLLLHLLSLREES